MNHQHRKAVLEALDQLAVPSGAEEVSAYAQVFLDTTLHLHDLETLRVGERHAWEGGERREAWICPAILDHLDFPPDGSLLTRSDWPLENRVLTIGSEPVRNLWLVRRLCRLVVTGLAEHRPNVEALMNPAARRVALLLPSGIVEAHLRVSEDLAPAPATIFDTVDPTTYRKFVIWGEMAEDAYEVLAGPDLRSRRSFAERLSLEANLGVRLFGEGA